MPLLIGVYTCALVCQYTGEPGKIQPALEYIEKKSKEIMQEHVPGKVRRHLVYLAPM